MWQRVSYSFKLVVKSVEFLSSIETNCANSIKKTKYAIKSKSTAVQLYEENMQRETIPGKIPGGDGQGLAVPGPK